MHAGRVDTPYDAYSSNRDLERRRLLLSSPDVSSAGAALEPETAKGSAGAQGTAVKEEAEAAAAAAPAPAAGAVSSGGTSSGGARKLLVKLGGCGGREISGGSAERSRNATEVSASIAVGDYVMARNGDTSHWGRGRVVGGKDKKHGWLVRYQCQGEKHMGLARFCFVKSDENGNLLRPPAVKGLYIRHLSREEDSAFTAEERDAPEFALEPNDCNFKAGQQVVLIGEQPQFWGGLHQWGDTSAYRHCKGVIISCEKDSGHSYLEVLVEGDAEPVSVRRSSVLMVRNDGRGASVPPAGTSSAAAAAAAPAPAAPASAVAAAPAQTTALGRAQQSDRGGGNPNASSSMASSAEAAAVRPLAVTSTGSPGGRLGGGGSSASLVSDEADDSSRDGSLEAGYRRKRLREEDEMRLEASEEVRWGTSEEVEAAERAKDRAIELSIAAKERLDQISAEKEALLRRHERQLAAIEAQEGRARQEFDSARDEANGLVEALARHATALVQARAERDAKRIPNRS